VPRQLVRLIFLALLAIALEKSFSKSTVTKINFKQGKKQNSKIFIDPLKWI
jgi:hypothetical protein